MKLINIFLFFLVCYVLFPTFSEGKKKTSTLADKIKHIVAIMFENRSFDHMLGYLRYNNSNIDGCVPDLENITCSNPLDPDNPNSARYGINFNASYIQPADPGHGIGDTSFEVFGTNDPNDPRFNFYPPPMDGFIKDYSTRDTMHPNGTFIMASFPANKVPIITTLAQEFALFDRWFADVPGPTNPNRLFSWIATSGGMGYNNDQQETIGFRQLSLFELIDKQNKINNNSNDTLDWKIYFEDLPSPIFLDYVRKFPRRFHSMDDFYADALNGKLPFFSWLDPRYNDLVGLPASDQHPDHDVRKGEETMKRIYESVRNSDKWNETLLLVFYDEHGGFFDHVPPPLTLNPDNLNATDVSPPFYFNRLGIRIPAILISPYVTKGSMALRPDSSSLNQYSHSSLIHTIREQFLPDFINKPLTKRDEISATFEYLINLDEPRTDCITKLPDVPTDDDDDNNKINEWIPGLQPVGDFQYDLLLISGHLCNVSKYDIDNNYIKNQDTAGKFAIDCMNKWLGNKVVSY